MTLATELTKFDLDNTQAVLDYNNDIKKYYLSLGQRGRINPAPKQPETYQFYKKNYTMACDYLGVHHLDLQDSSHQSTLQQVIDCNRHNNFELCHSNIAVYLLKQEVNRANNANTWTQRGLHVADGIATGVISAFVSKPDPRLAVPAAMGAGWQLFRTIGTDDEVSNMVPPLDNQRFQLFIDGITKSTPEFDLAEKSATKAMALYRYKALEAALQIPDLPEQGREQIQQAIAENLASLVDDPPPLMSCLRNQDDISVNKYGNWLENILNEFGGQQGELYDAIYLLETRMVENNGRQQELIQLVRKEESLLCEILEENLQARNKANTQYVEKIKQQTLQEGLYFIASLASLAGNTKLSQNIMTIGNATLKINNALQDMQNLKNIANSGGLAAIFPALAIANAAISVIGLFNKNEDGLGKALQNIYRELSQQIQQISVQLVELQNEIRQNFTVIYNVLITMYETLLDGFEKTHHSIEKLQQLSDEIYQHLDRQKAVQTVRHSDLMSKKIRHIHAFLDTIKNKDKLVLPVKLLRDAYQYAVVDAKALSMSSDSDSLDAVVNGELESTDIIQLMTKVAEKEGGILTPALVNLHLFEQGLLYYLLLLQRSSTTPSELDLTQVLAGFIENQLNIERFVCELRSAQGLSLFQKLIENCCQFLRNIQIKIDEIEFVLMNRALRQPIDDLFDQLKTQISLALTIDNTLQKKILASSMKKIQQIIATCDQDKSEQLEKLEQLRIQAFQAIENKDTNFDNIPQTLTYSRKFIENIPRHKKLFETPNNQDVQIEYDIPLQITLQDLYKKVCEAQQPQLREDVLQALSHIGSPLNLAFKQLAEHTSLLNAYVEVAHYQASKMPTTFTSFVYLQPQTCPWASKYIIEGLSYTRFPAVFFQNLVKTAVGTILPMLSQDLKTASALDENEITLVNPRINIINSLIDSITEETHSFLNSARPQTISPVLSKQKSEKLYNSYLGLFSKYQHYVTQLPPDPVSAYYDGVINNITTTIKQAQEIMTNLSSSPSDKKHHNKMHKIFTKIISAFIELAADKNKFPYLASLQGNLEQDRNSINKIHEKLNTIYKSSLFGNDTNNQKSYDQLQSCSEFKIN